MQAQQVLRQRFPGMEVIPSTYPVSAQKVGCFFHDLTASQAHPHLCQKYPLCQRRARLQAWTEQHVSKFARPPAVNESPGSVLADLPCWVLQAALGRVVMGLQFGGIAAVLGGDRIFPALGMEMPQMLAQMREKKMGVVMGIWLLGNALQNQLSATGAFEVFYDGKQVRTLCLSCCKHDHVCA